MTIFMLVLGGQQMHLDLLTILSTFQMIQVSFGASILIEHLEIKYVVNSTYTGYILTK